MLTRENAKQAKFFLRLFICSLVAGVALATIISGSFDASKLYGKFFAAKKSNTKDVQLKVLNPDYLKLNFGVEDLEAEVAAQNAEEELQSDQKTNKVSSYKYKKKTRVNKISGNELVQVEKLDHAPKKRKVPNARTVAAKKISPPKKEREFNYEISEGVEITNKLSLSEFVELQEFITEDKFAYENSDQYIADNKVNEETRNTALLLAALQITKKDLTKAKEANNARLFAQAKANERSKRVFAARVAKKTVVKKIAKLKPTSLKKKDFVIETISTQAATLKRKLQLQTSLPAKTIVKAPAPKMPYVRKGSDNLASVNDVNVIKSKKIKMRKIKEEPIKGTPIYVLKENETDTLASVIASLEQSNKAALSISGNPQSSVNTQAGGKGEPQKVLSVSSQNPEPKPIAKNDKISDQERGKRLEPENTRRPKREVSVRVKTGLEDKLKSILQETYADRMQASGQIDYSTEDAENLSEKTVKAARKAADESSGSGLYAVVKPVDSLQEPPVTSQTSNVNSQRSTQTVNDNSVAANDSRTKNFDEGVEVRPAANGDIMVSSKTRATPSLTPAENTSSNAPERVITVKGMLTGAWAEAKGHFEVGVYHAIDSNGEPVGAPIRQAILPPGKRTFKLRLSNKQSGYIFARHYSNLSESKVPKWHAYGLRLELDQYDRNSLLSIPIRMKDSRNRFPASIARKAIQKRSEALRGRVSAMFSSKEAPHWVQGAIVRLRGTNIEATTNRRGEFNLQATALGGRALLEVLAPGYLPRVVEAEFGRSGEINQIEIASKSAIKHLARSLGVSQSDSLSVMIVDTSSTDGVNLPGISTQLSLKADGPFYFNENGFPDRDLLSTTSNGKLVYFNVEPGIGFLETFVLGQTVSPIVVSVLDGNELVHRNVRFSSEEMVIKGKLFDPIESNSGVPLPISGARVRVAGSVEWTETDSFGSFELPVFRFAEGNEILLEVSARGYYKHRFSLRVSNQKLQSLAKLKLFVFPKSYIADLANSVDLNLDPNKGLLIGKISLDEKVRIDTLSEHSSSNLAKDYYFDENNLLRGSYAFTRPGNGLFSVFNVSPGRALLHGYNSDGTLRYSGISYFSPSTINVIVE